MRKSKFTESQIVSILNEVESGMKVNEVCRKHGISSQTYYTWKSKYGGMGVSDIKRLKELEAENAKLKKCLQIWHWKIMHLRISSKKSSNA